MSIKKGGLFLCPKCDFETEDIEEIKKHVLACKKLSLDLNNLMAFGMMVVGLELIGNLFGGKKKKGKKLGDL